MNIISIVLYIAVVGFLVWLILQIQMPQVFRNLIVGVAAILVILYILQSIGVMPDLPRVHFK